MKEDLFKFPLYILTHPIDGFEEFKRYKRGKLYVAIVFILLMSVLSILDYYYTGFIVNPNNPDDLNSISEILYILTPVFLFSLGNWSITTLMDGKGTFKEIFMMTSYSLFPMIVIGYFLIIFSNVITIEEMEFYYILKGVAVFLTGYMIFFGLIMIHEYSLLKAMLTVILTIFAMGVIMFISLLFFDLIQQVLGFLISIYKEISLRYF